MILFQNDANFIGHDLLLEGKFSDITSNLKVGTCGCESWKAEGCRSLEYKVEAILRTKRMQISEQITVKTKD